MSLEEEEKASAAPQEIDFCTLGMFIIGKEEIDVPQLRIAFSQLLLALCYCFQPYDKTCDTLKLRSDI